VGEIAAGLAHELNQPLAAIANYGRGCLRRIDMKADVMTLREALQHIVSQADRAGEMIRHLRRYAKQGGEQFTAASVNQLILDCHALLQAEAIRHQAELVEDLDHSLPAVRCDPIQIEQVLVNLVRNAFDAVSRQPPPRTIRVSTGRGRDGLVEVTVSDNGPGVDPSIRGRIFEQFFSTSSEATGLGLPMSRSILEGHGGMLWHDATVTDGATFKFVLPVVRSSPA